jgi:hypothetical protein
MASCPQCGATFDNLQSHIKQLHSARISVRFASRPNALLVLARDPASNEFICPGCDKGYEKYQHMYNHAKRVPATDTCHARKLSEYISGSACEDEAAGVLNGPPAGRAEDSEADSLMADGTGGPHWQPVGSGSTNFDDIEMDPQEIPPTTPKHTPKFTNVLNNIATDDFSDVDMEAFYAPYEESPPTTTKPIPTASEPASSDSEDSRPRFAAAEKGKGKQQLEAVSSAPPQPSAAPPTSLCALPLLVPLPRALPTEPPGSPSEAVRTLQLPIQYESEDFHTTALLNTVNCVVYQPLKILICIVCSTAVQPSHLKSHRKGTMHADPGSVPETLVAYLITDLQVQDTDTLQDQPMPMLVVPGIPFYADGFKCPVQGCNHCRRSMVTMKRHIKDAHLIRDQSPTACAVQAIFVSNSTYYPVTLPESLQVTKAPPNLDEMTEMRYNNILSQIDSSALLDAAHLSPFLTKYKWHEVVAGLEPSSLSQWTSPPMTDDIALTGLKAAVTAYYEMIAMEMGAGESWTTVLRFVNTAKL